MAGRSNTRAVLMPWTAPPPARKCHRCGCGRPRFGGAKHASGYDNRPRHRKVSFSGPRHRRGRGKVLLRRQLKRRYVLAFFQKLPPCLVGIEACASSHHWSRELQALGHTVRLMPPAYVKPYVKRQKKRCRRCRSDLRSGHPGQHAVRRDQDARAAELPDAPSHAPSLHPPADLSDQCDPRPSCMALSHRSDVMVLNNCSMW